MCRARKKVIRNQWNVSIVWHGIKIIRTRHPPNYFRVVSSRTMRRFYYTEYRLMVWLLVFCCTLHAISRWYQWVIKERSIVGIWWTQFIINTQRGFVQKLNPIFCKSLYIWSNTLGVGNCYVLDMKISTNFDKHRLRGK